MQEHCDQANRVEFHEEQEHERKVNKKEKEKKKQYKNRMKIAKQNSVENGASIDATETLLFTPTPTLAVKEKRHHTK